MKSLDFGRNALSSCVAVAMLAACGGSQPLNVTPRAMPQSRAIVHRATASGELLYATEPERSDMLVFSYPQGKLVQTLTFAYPPFFLCSDHGGDVFVPATNASYPGYIYEFAHGGTQPIETLTDPGPGYAQSCSVDPTTGNLAVANGLDVAVYPEAQGTPIVYEASEVGAWDCAYDDSGDLFVDGHSYQDKIAELPAGGTNFSNIALSEPIITRHLQWRGKSLLLQEPPLSAKGPYQIFKVRISGSNGIVSGPLTLYGENKHRATGNVEFSLFRKTIVMPDGPGYSLINLWHYPKGGKPYKVIDLRPRNHTFYGVAISK